MDSSPNPIPLLSKSHKAVFLDRDGIINKVLIKEGKVCSPRTMAEFEWMDDIIESVKIFKEIGFKIIVVTNQPDIARGKMAKEILAAMTNLIYSTLMVDDVLVCPHDDLDGCNCRKPSPGLILEASGKWDVDCRQSFMIGDSWKDMSAGRAAGCTTILIDQYYNQGTEGHYRVKDLKGAVEIIVNSL
jgi:D-glycero-D-manno-heptose 1,7-bisphosphate phosphatase